MAVMTNGKNDDRDALDRVTANLADDLLNTSDDALLKEVREDGGDPQAVAAHGLAIFEKAASFVAKSRLAAAKAAVAATRLGHQNVIPIGPTEARALLTRVLAHHPEATNNLTLAARKAVGEASDADVRDMLEDLSELGISFDDLRDA